jgi:hypothetical protein
MAGARGWLSEPKGPYTWQSRRAKVATRRLLKMLFRPINRRSLEEQDAYVSEVADELTHSAPRADSAQVINNWTESV